MIPVLTRAQMQAYDRHAIEECSVPGLVLMENAGRGATEAIATRLAASGEGAVASPVVIVCGPGNNGGDGFVVARHLAARDVHVQVFLAGDAERVRGDARHNLDAYRGIGGQVRPLGPEAERLGALRDALAGACLVVDALFGTGLDRPVAGYRGDLIDLINEASCDCVAIDIPSGVDADTGQVLGKAVRAALTVTFGRHKIGMLGGRGASLAGRVEVVGLGLPDEAIVAAVGHCAEIVEPHAVGRWLGSRPVDVHKYRAGSLLVVAGRPGKVGAALLCGRAALRAGAGIVTIGTWPEAASAIDAQVSEVMSTRLDPARLESSLQSALAKRSAVAIGPGLGLDARARKLVDAVVLGWDGPCVVDADGLTHFAGRLAELREAAGPRVLTPHTGELARLLEISSSEIEADRFEAARRAARRSGATVVLKGPHTVIATPAGPVFLCLRGNPVLATAGSGDVLTGVVGALLCELPAERAAAAGVFLHAVAADQWRAGHDDADRGLVASDITAGLPTALAWCRAS